MHFSDAFSESRLLFAIWHLSPRTCLGHALSAGDPKQELTLESMSPTRPAHAWRLKDFREGGVAGVSTCPLGPLQKPR